MTHTKLFVSTCTRRDLALRRRSHSWSALDGIRLSQVVLTTLAFVVVCGGAFLAGHGGF